MAGDSPDPREGSQDAGAPHRLLLHVVLFGLTGVTTTLAGVALANDLPISLLLEPLWVVLQHPAALLSGLWFSVPLLAIFLAHEMGHFVVARRAGVDASLPYFIPLPFGLGTLGAIINMRAGSRSRGALLEIGAAGPLIGFGVAFAVLLVGFSLSEVKSAEEIALIAQSEGVVVEGDSLVYALARWIIFGPLAPGADVWIHPTAWAGWFGMYLTWLNLQPFSQFDGGHITYAIVGSRARAITLGVYLYLVIFFLVTLNPFWISLLIVHLGLGWVLGLTHPPVEDPTPLSPRHKVIAALCALVFLATFVPDPWHPHEATVAAQVEVAP